MSLVRDRHIDEAAICLREGGVVAFPTETVYGLGADARNPQAVRQVYALKGRPADHPLIVHVAGRDEAVQWASELSDIAKMLMSRFWPGPLTLVVPARDDVPREVTGGQDSVALRSPNHPLALDLLSAFGGGLAAPSANPFGQVSPTEAAHVHSYFGDKLTVLDGGPCRFGLESTIVSLLGERPRILRPGALPLAVLREVLGDEGLDNGSSSMNTPRVPGSLPAHYAPSTPLEIHGKEHLAERARALLEQGLRLAILQIDRGLPDALANSRVQRFLLPANPEGFGRYLYGRLREIDDLAFDRLLVEAPPEDEAWWAVNDRLARASQGGKPGSC